MKKKTKKKMVRKPLQKPAKKTPIFSAKGFSQENRILLSVLAQTDAVWLPCRKPSEHLWENIYAARRQFDNSGLPWNSDKALGGGGTGVERMELSRVVSELISAGYLSTNRDKQSRATNVKLTPTGDDLARRLADVPEYLLGVLALDKLYKIRTSPMCFEHAIQHRGKQCTLIWADERLVLGGKWPPGPLTKQQRWEICWQESMFLPLLIRGLAVSLANVGGAVHYALTPSGTKLAQQRKARGTGKEPAFPDRNDAAAAFYQERLAAELSALCEQPVVRERDVGELPLPMAPSNPRPGASKLWAELFA